MTYLSIPTLLDAMGSEVLIILRDNRYLMGNDRRVLLGGPVTKQENDSGSQSKALVLTRTCPRDSGDWLNGNFVLLVFSFELPAQINPDLWDHPATIIRTNRDS